MKLVFWLMCSILGVVSGAWADKFIVADDLPIDFELKRYQWKHDVSRVIQSKYDEATEEFVAIDEKVRRLMNVSYSGDSLISKEEVLLSLQERRDKLATALQVERINRELMDIKNEQNIIRRALFNVAVHDNQLGLHSLDLIRKLESEEKYFILKNTVDEMTSEELGIKIKEYRNNVSGVRGVILSKIDDESFPDDLGEVLEECNSWAEMQVVVSNRADVLKTFLEDNMNMGGSITKNETYLELANQYSVARSDLATARGIVCLNNPNKYLRDLNKWHESRVELAILEALLKIR